MRNNFGQILQFPDWAIQRVEEFCIIGISERIEHFFPSFTLLTLGLGYLFVEKNEQKILNKMLPRKEKNQKETSSIYPEGSHCWGGKSLVAL